MTDLAKTLSILRIIRGWSQSELAEEARVTSSAISDYERGKVDPQTQTLQKIMGALGFPMATLDQTVAFIRLIKAQMGTPGREEPSGTATTSELLGEEREMQGELARLASEGGRVASQTIYMVLKLLARR